MMKTRMKYLMLSGKKVGLPSVSKKLGGLILKRKDKLGYNRKKKRIISIVLGTLFA